MAGIGTVHPGFLETSIAAFGMLDQQLLWTAVNSRLADLLGYGRDELPGRPWSEQATCSQQLDNLLAGQAQTVKFLARLRHRDGHQVLANIAAERQEDPDSPRILVLVEPATEWLAQTQELLHDRRTDDALYRTIVQTTPDGFYILDGETGCFLEVNEVFCRLMGYSQDELLNMSWGDVQAGSSAAVSSPADLVEHSHFELELKRRDGTLFLADISVSALPGLPLRLLGFCVNVTARREATQQLTENERRFRAIFEQSAIGIAIVTPSGHTLRANERLCELAGCSSSELVGRSLLLYAHPEDAGETEHELGHVLRGERDEFTARLRLIHQDGAIVWVKLVTGLVMGADNEPKYIIMMAEDITVQQESRAELQRVNDELQRKNRELEQVVYVASHDLRSPLVNVQGFSRELAASLDDLKRRLERPDVPAEVCGDAKLILEEDIPESLHFILSSISKMDHLLSGLLRLSRLGRAALRIEVVDMNQLLKEILADYEYQVKQDGIKLQVGTLPPCLGDRVQIQQVMSNLVGNAVKYLNPANEQGHVEIGGERRSGRVVFWVADNGIGIAPEHQDKIFELYHRLRPDDTAGEGLGLTIIRTILDRHQGRIWLESAEGAGSCFYVELPSP